MKNKKYFFSGVAVGIVCVLIFNVIFIKFTYSFLPKSGLGKDEWVKITNKGDKIVSLLDRYYLEGIERDKMEEGTYAGLVASLGDPYTSYFDKDKYKEFTINNEGSYAGIGAVVTQNLENMQVLIVQSMEGSPSEKAGLLPLDRIIKVDNEDISGLELSDVSEKMMGPEGSQVNITIYRESINKTFDVTVKRAIIEMPTVKQEMLEDNLGYIKVIGFDAVTYNQFLKALYDLEAQGERGLIIDLRNNPGGRLDVVARMIDVFLPKDKIITYTEDKHGNRKTLKSEDDKYFNKPLVILTNENSASASEIFAGAIKDYNLGKLVGETTFGKGLVQQLIELGDGSAVKVTISKYFTPAGNYINKKGIKPDVEVELPEEVKEKFRKTLILTKEEDNQLSKAIEVLKDQIK